MHLFSFPADDAGATAIEYGLIAALISIAIVGASLFVGGGVSNLFNFLATQVAGAGSN